MSAINELRETPLTISEKLLLWLSRKSQSHSSERAEEWSPDSALSQLSAAFPDFLISITDRDVLDFGCGTGCQAVSLARAGARRVLGFDINSEYVEKARKLAQKTGFESQVTFTDRFDDRLNNRFDIVISQNSMEHFADPAGALWTMRAALKESGKILVTFGPLWFSPHGSHMDFFCSVPWLNILFAESTVMNIRRRYIDDGANRYGEVEGGLNKMSVAKFERIVAASGLRPLYQKYRCVKGLNFIGGIAGIRELFVNQIDLIATRAGL